MYIYIYTLGLYSTITVPFVNLLLHLVRYYLVVVFTQVGKSCNNHR